MKKLFIFLGILVVILILFVFSLLSSDDSISEMTKNINNSSEVLTDDNTSGVEYDVDVYDDTIIFSDGNGGTIVYTFSDDRLENVQQMIVVDDEDKVKYIEEIFKEQIANGTIEKFISQDTTISITYNMALFEEYKNLTKEEIQDMILEQANIVEKIGE